MNPMDDLACATGPRMMLYSQDGLGLGHMRRTSSLAAEFLRRHPQACVLTLADSSLGQFFENSPNHDYIKLPSILKIGPGDWRAAHMSLPFADVAAMRRELIRSAVLSFQPHILLVDHMPHGAMGELLPTLEALHGSSASTQVVLGLRDILDAPEVIRQRWRVEGAYEAVESYYDLVLAYGQSGVFDLASEYDFSPAIARRLQYCGYVFTPAPARTTARVRAQNLAGAAPDTRLIVAMAGGGADAYPMMRALVDALPALNAQQPSVLTLITGPFMPPHLRRDLEARIRYLPARLRVSVNDTPSYLEAADLVVAMAGYNTSMEILRWARQAVLVPRAGPSAEQRIRARLFAAKGWVEVIEPEHLDAAHVASRLGALLSTQPPIHPSCPDLRGLSTAIRHLEALLPPAVLAASARSRPAERPTSVFSSATA